MFQGSLDLLSLVGRLSLLRCLSLSFNVQREFLSSSESYSVYVIFFTFTFEIVL